MSSIYDKKSQVSLPLFAQGKSKSRYELRVDCLSRESRGVLDRKRVLWREKMEKKKKEKREQGNNILCTSSLWTPCLPFLELDTYSGQLNEEKRNSIDRDQGGPQCVTDRNGIIERFSRATTMRIESQKSTKQVVQRLVFSSMNTGREIRIDFFFVDYNFELYSRYF